MPILEEDYEKLKESLAELKEISTEDPVELKEELPETDQLSINDNIPDEEKQTVFGIRKTMEIPGGLGSKQFTEIVLDKSKVNPPTLANIPEKEYSLVFNAITKATIDKKSNTSENHIFTKYVHMQSEKKNCEFILSAATKANKEVSKIRLVSFLTKSKKENREIVLCFDLVELRQVALDEFEVQKAKENNKGLTICDVLIPNIGKLYLPEDLQEDFNWTHDYFSLEDSQRIHRDYEHYSNYLLNQDHYSLDLLKDLVEFWIAPMFRKMLEKIPQMFEHIFGKKFVETAITLFFPVKWLIQKGWSVGMKLIEYPLSIIKPFLKKIWTSTLHYRTFIANNISFINIAMYCLSILKILFCVFFLGPKVGIQGLSRWLREQSTLSTLGGWADLIVKALQSLMNCIVQIGTKGILGILLCGWDAFQIILESVFKVGDVLLKSIYIWFKGVGESVRLQMTPQDYKGISSDRVREIGLGMFSLDWDVVSRGIWLFLPKLLRTFLGWVPLPPYLYKITDIGIVLTTRVRDYFMVYTNIINFVFSSISTVWECINFSGNCCFPNALKHAFSDAVKREELDIAEQAKQHHKNLEFDNRLSDPRAKIDLGPSGLVVDGLDIHLFAMNPTFFHKIKKFKQKYKLPPWLQHLYQKTYFHEKGSTFYSVNADKLQKKYPDAVRRWKTRNLDFLYIDTKKLPEKLRETLFRINAKHVGLKV